MKRILAAALLICLVLTGCAQSEPEKNQYSATFLTAFDTVTTIVGLDENEEAFREKAQIVYDELFFYHRLFDIYNDYEGINNIKTINDNAGIAPVKVDSAVIELLADCRAFCEVSGGKVNVAMGSVLHIWHEAREAAFDDPNSAYVPQLTELEAAAQHTDFDSVIIDEENSTVYISDEKLRLDVGAVAKGWAVQKVAENAPSGLLISVGGNVCATGPKDEDDTPWVIGIQDPDGGQDYLHTLYLTEGSAVTSGDYQRYYEYDGRMYHHIIDPDTLYPAENWRAVTVICGDSGTADMLSTALFILPQDEGQKLLDKYGAEALWVKKDGSMLYSPGFEAMIRT